MPDLVAPVLIDPSGGGGVTVAQVQTIIDGQGHVEDQGIFADLPTADAFIPGGGVPAGETWIANLADGTPLTAQGGETTWTVQAGTGTVVDLGLFSSITTANAAATFPVPNGQGLIARTSSGTMLVASEGATSFTAVDPLGVRRLGPYPDLATANAAAIFPIPANVAYEALLTDGTRLQANPTDGAWSEVTGPGETRFQGEHATVGAADATIPGGGVPAGQTYLATIGGNVLAIARTGETTFTPLGGATTGSVQNQGAHATVAVAETASGFPGTPVPAGEIYLAATPTQDLIAYPGETGYRVNWRNQWPGVYEIGSTDTISVRPGSRVYIDNGGTVVLPASTEYQVSPWVTLIEPAGVDWNPGAPPLLALPPGDTIVANIPWTSGEVHLERLPATGEWQARADAEPGHIDFQDPTLRTADFTVSESTNHDVDSSGGPVAITVPTGTETFSIRQAAGTQTTVNAPLNQGGTSVTLNEVGDWVRFELQPNGLYGMVPLDNWASSGSYGVTLTQVNNIVQAEAFPQANLSGPVTVTHTRPICVVVDLSSVM